MLDLIVPAINSPSPSQKLMVIPQITSISFSLKLGGVSSYRRCPPDKQTSYQTAGTVSLKIKYYEKWLDSNAKALLDSVTRSVEDFTKTKVTDNAEAIIAILR